MHRFTPRDVKMRFDALHSVRRTVEEHWQLIERYVVPGRGKFFQDERSGSNSRIMSMSRN